MLLPTWCPLDCFRLLKKNMHVPLTSSCINLCGLCKQSNSSKPLWLKIPLCPFPKYRVPFSAGTSMHLALLCVSSFLLLFSIIFTLWKLYSSGRQNQPVCAQHNSALACVCFPNCVKKSEHIESRRLDFTVCNTVLEITFPLQLHSNSLNIKSLDAS